MEIKSDIIYKGTKIIFGEEANTKRDYLNRCIDYLRTWSFNEISIPVIQFQSTFALKVGEENNNMMFNFTDRGNRELCLAPEYTAVIQNLTKESFKYEKDVKLFYIQECFRGEKPQAGRYRQFTQLGVEILNPSKDYSEFIVQMAQELIIYSCKNIDDYKQKNFITNTSVKRGLDYYKDGQGFEISCDELGAQKQVCGGGEYDGGVGFAIGIDRVLLLK